MHMAFKKIFSFCSKVIFKSGFSAELEAPTQPAMMSFKQFLSSQDDNITDEEAIKKFNEYKLDFKRQQIKEFFEQHRSEEWYVDSLQNEAYLWVVVGKILGAFTAIILDIEKSLSFENMTVFLVGELYVFNVACISAAKDRSICEDNQQLNIVDL